MLSLEKYIKDVERFDVILTVFFEEGFEDLIQKLKLHHRVQTKNKKHLRSQEEGLRKSFERLGPTFIKLGQLLSTRPDLVPVSYAKEFEKLREHAPEVEFTTIKQIVEAELDDKIEHVFQQFDKKPLATASIAQVHKATLRSGQTVVVKVQKPDIRNLIERDLDIMFFLAHLLNRFSRFENYDIVRIVKEFSIWTLRELDFIQEAKNIAKFRSNLKDCNIAIPKAYEQYTTAKLLVMDFEDVEHLPDHKWKKSSTEAFIHNFTNIICKMVFEDGFFHGDPHLGNVFVTKNGKPVLLDFGMVGSLEEKLRSSICEIFINLLDENTDETVEQIIKITHKRRNADIETYKKEAKQIIQNWYDKPLGKCSLILTFYKLVSQGAQHGVVFPVELVLLAKAFLNLEGIAVQVSPVTRVQDIIRPYIQKAVLVKYSPMTLLAKSIVELKKNREFYADLPEHVARLLHRIDAGELDFHMDENELHEMEQTISYSINKQSVALIVTALIVTAPIFYFFEITVSKISLGLINVLIAFVLLIYLMVMISRPAPRNM